MDVLLLETHPRLIPVRRRELFAVEVVAFSGGSPTFSAVAHQAHIRRYVGFTRPFTSGQEQAATGRNPFAQAQLGLDVGGATLVAFQVIATQVGDERCGDGRVGAFEEQVL